MGLEGRVGWGGRIVFGEMQEVGAGAGGGGLSLQDCAVITGLRLHGTSQEWCQLGALLFADSRGSGLSHKEVRLIPRYGTRREGGDAAEY